MQVASFLFSEQNLGRHEADKNSGRILPPNVAADSFGSTRYCPGQGWMKVWDVFGTEGHTDS